MDSKQLPWIILMTHGEAGASLKKSAEMIIGEMEDVYCLSLMEGRDPADYAEELKKLLVDAPDWTIILTDLYGGTPCNMASVFATQKEYTVLSGLNLAMLIEAESQRAALPGEELTECIQAAAVDGIKDIRKIMKERREK